MTALDKCFEAQRRKTLSHRSRVLKPNSHRSSTPRSRTNDYSKLFMTDANFFQQRPLIAATLTRKTRDLYMRAFQEFRKAVPQEPNDANQLDCLLSAYIEEIYSEDASAKNRQEIANLISFLCLTCPCVKKQLGLSRRALSGWVKLTPTRSALPLTRNIMYSFDNFFARGANYDACTAVALQWATYMRGSEVIALRRSDVALPGDIRLIHHGVISGGVNIEASKTGPMQFTPIRDMKIISLLRAFLSSRSADPSKPLFNLSYSQYNSLLKEAAGYFGLDVDRFTSHSARIGGALSDYCRGISAQTIAITGRWKSFSSLERYLQNGRAWLIRMPMSPYSQRRLQQSSQQFMQLLHKCEANITNQSYPQNHTRT